MSQQLVKKGANGRIVNVNPKSWIEAIKDKNTGQTLVEILQGFNMYFLPYNGNTSSTRCLVPTILRKKGLWITYVKYDGNVYTEWYAADELDDKSWGDSSNWRVGNNTLVGDITISANGNWVINGTETEFKAVGEKGNTPLLRVANNRLQVSYDLGDTYIDVTNNPVYTKFRWLATTGDTQANNVGRIQASTDEGKTWTNMSNDFTNNLHIKKYIGVNESLPTSGIAEGTIYAKGPYYAEDDTLNDNPIYRLWVYAWKGNTLAWQDNGEFQSIAAGVVQETGDSETKVMSQKAVSEKLAELGSKTDSKLSELDEETDKKIKDLPSVGHSSFDLEIADESGVMLVGFRDGHIETKNFKSAEVEQQYESIKEEFNKRIESIESELVDFAEADNSTTESDLDITDEDGNIIARYHDGVHETKYPSPFTKDDNLADFEITDKENNVIFRIKDGVPQTKKFDGGKISANVVAQVSSSIGRGQMRTSYPLIASNEKIELLDFPRYLDTRKFFSFIGYMSNFPSDAHFDFGIRYKYNGQYWHDGAWMRITSTKVELYQDSNENQSTLKESYNHGLTLSHFVKVFFYLREDYGWYIILETLKGKFVIEYEGGSEKEIVGHPYLLNNGIVFNDAQITAGSADFKSPIWIFGDSYSTASYGYTRLGQQLMDLGISQNTCYNHLGGNNHGNAWDDLRLMLKFGTPRMIVWMLGVNGSQPQNVQITNDLKKLCDNMGIELVFQYPPLYPNSVGIDTTNLRNAVLATGCRIVNTSRAVGCDNSSGDAVWYDGYLDGDRIHPTELASRAIVMQLINDVPELLQWGLNEKPIYYSSNNN